MKTTVIGSYPKPPYLKIPDWFSSSDIKDINDINEDKDKETSLTCQTNELIKKENQEQLEPIILRAIEDVIKEQTDIGIDIITDGEIRRENYIYSFCRSLTGIDFENLTENIMRNGAYKINCPTVVSELSYQPELYQSDEWLISNKIAEKHGKILKYTLPGPMTICDSISDIYYNNDKQLCKDLAKLIRREILHLKEIGCRYIQIDEPLFARKSEIALEWGIDLLDMIVKDISDIHFTVHICCGYPMYLDQTDYKKAPNCSYSRLAERLDRSKLDAISIEDKHCHLDLTFLEMIKNKTIVFGVIAIAKSKIETVDEIKKRISEVLEYIDKDRLIIAPDCGLGYLPHDILYQKLNNMVEAVKSFR